MISALPQHSRTRPGACLQLCNTTAQSMLDVLKNMLFGCAHRRTTFPLTPCRKLGPRTARPAADGMYVACLDCGKEFHYEWNEMRRGELILHRRKPALNQVYDAALSPAAPTPNFKSTR